MTLAKFPRLVSLLNGEGRTLSEASRLFYRGTLHGRLLATRRALTSIRELVDADEIMFGATTPRAR